MSLRACRSSARPIRPNTDGLYAGKRLRTNSLGFRGSEIALEKPPDTYRVVIIGDSVTMGHGVSDHETYASTPGN